MTGYNMVHYNDSLSAAADLWAQIGGNRKALTRLHFTGLDPVLPSSFKVGTVAQSSIGVSALAATELWRMRTGKVQDVSVDMLHAALEFNSEKCLRVNGERPPKPWNEFSGFYRIGNSGCVRLHTNFTHHRDAVINMLGCGFDRKKVEEELLNWDPVEFETRAHEAGGVVAFVRSGEEWAAHPQGQAVRAIPAITIEKIGEAPARPLPDGPRPLSGQRVLEFTRVIAGPVGGRTLAAHGATVMRIDAPGATSFEWAEWLDKDTGRGKLSSAVSIKTPEGLEKIHTLLRDTDIFIDGYRPDALPSHGLGPHAVARIRPGIVCVSLSAYAHNGPWAKRRGFDSLVQSLNGMDHSEGLAAGEAHPRVLPCQALDHVCGYMIAAAAMMVRARQAEEGGSWLIRVSLDRAGQWIWSQGQIQDGFDVDSPYGAIRDLREAIEAPIGTVEGLRHAAILSETPTFWARPPVSIGTHEPVWPEE